MPPPARHGSSLQTASVGIRAVGSLRTPIGGPTRAVIVATTLHARGSCTGCIALLRATAYRAPIIRGELLVGLTIERREAEGQCDNESKKLEAHRYLLIVERRL